MLAIAASPRLIAPLPAQAVEATEILPDPALGARARALSAQFRCLVCQNEWIDESNAELAHELRVLIRKQVAEGRSDAQIRDFLVARYGQLVLLRPRFDGETLLLWLGPFIVLVGGGVALAIAARGRPRSLSEPLSPERRRDSSSSGAG